MQKKIHFPIQNIEAPEMPSLYRLKDDIKYTEWSVDDYYVFPGYVIDHEWIPGTTIKFNCHLITSGLSDEDSIVCFDLETYTADVGSVISEKHIISTNEAIIPANTPHGTHLSFPFTPLTMIGKQSGCALFMKLVRSQVEYIHDEPPGFPFLFALTMNLECQKTEDNDYVAK